MNYIIYVFLFILILIIAFIIGLTQNYSIFVYGGVKTTTPTVTINETLMSSNLLHDILNIIKKRHYTTPNYSIMSNDDINFYERQAHLLENKYKKKYELMRDQLFSVRNSEMLVYISHCINKVKHMAKIIKEDFENGFDITLIADKNKIPYIMTLRQLLYSYNFSKKDIKDMLKKRKKFPDKLNAINSEIDFILKSDLTSYVNNAKKKKAANEFENEVAAFLDKNNIKYISENENRKKNVQGPKTTPDFLLKSKIIVNGFKTNWVEVKNYLYYGNAILEPGVHAQAKKYYKAHGTGVFIFKYGVAKKANIEGVHFMGWK